MWEPTSIVFGVRHKSRFAYLDRAGEMLDDIIDAQEAGDLPAGVEFDQVNWQKTAARLQDARRAVDVAFNPDGIVVTVDPERSGLGRDAARALFLALLPRGLEATGGADSVNRIGTLENYRLPHDRSGEAAASALLGGLAGLGTAHDLALRVSFRTPTEQGLVRRDVSDWRNTIVQVWNRRSEAEEADQRALNVTIDYQSYFSPERPYSAALVEEHHRRFLERLEALQSGRLAGLAGEATAVR
jgi:hypothetical protein